MKNPITVLSFKQNSSPSRHGSVVFSQSSPSLPRLRGVRNREAIPRAESIFKDHAWPWLGRKSSRAGFINHL